MQFSSIKSITLAGLMFAVAVEAQSSSSAAVPSSVPGLSDCASACISQAATSNGCASFADITCVCTNAQFQLDAQECLQNQCPGDLQAALGLQSEECGAAGLSATGSATSDSFSATGISASATASGSGSALSSASSSAASGSASGSSHTSESTHASSTAPGSSHSASGTSGQSSASATTSNNSGAKVEYGYGFVVALVVSLAGAAIGGGFVL